MCCINHIIIIQDDNCTEVTIGVSLKGLSVQNQNRISTLYQ